VYTIDKIICLFHRNSVLFLTLSGKKKRPYISSWKLGHPVLSHGLKIETRVSRIWTYDTFAGSAKSTGDTLNKLWRVRLYDLLDLMLMFAYRVKFTSKTLLRRSRRFACNCTLRALLFNYSRLRVAMNVNIVKLADTRELLAGPQMGAMGAFNSIHSRRFFQCALRFSRVIKFESRCATTFPAAGE